MKTIEQYVAECSEIEAKKKLFGVRYMCKATGCAMKKVSVYVEPSDAELCVNCITSGRFDKAKDWHVIQGGSCRVDMLLGKDGKSALVQLCRYVPHTYEPRTEPVWVSEGEAENLKRFL